MTNSDSIVLGYDYDTWHGYGVKQGIFVDISPSKNSHTLICGMSGSGKSYAELIIFAKMVMTNPASEVYFADFKQEDALAFLRECPRYYPYDRTLEALNIVYEKMHKRQENEDKERYPIMLIWDEYVANMLALQNTNKEAAKTAMQKVAEILMLGRSLSVRLFTSCQRPDASVFPSGSRLNYGIVIVLGASIRSIYEMLLPDHMDSISGRTFETGEGVALLQGSELHFIKIPMVKDIEKMQAICKSALS